VFLTWRTRNDGRNLDHPIAEPVVACGGWGSRGVPRRKGAAGHSRPDDLARPPSAAPDVLSPARGRSPEGEGRGKSAALSAWPTRLSLPPGPLRRGCGR
jgi:hypothetical protein